MKKIIAALVISFLMLPIAFAYAEETNPVDRAQLTQFREQVKQKQAIIKENKTKNQALRESVKAKSQEVKGIIKTMRKNKTTFTMEQLDAIAAKVQAIKQERQNIAGISSLTLEHEKFRTNRANKNFEAALQNLDNIISIQSQRNEALERLSADLDALLASIK